MTPQVERWLPYLFPLLIVLSLVFGTWQIRSPLASIHITPTEATLVVGHELQFHATGERRNGKVIPQLPVLWAVDNARGRIDEQGRFRALEPGEVTVTARVEDIAAAIHLTIGEEPVARIETTVTPAQVVVGETATLTIRLSGATGRALAGIEARLQAETEGTTVTPPALVTDAAGQGTATLTTALQAQENRVVVQANARQETVVVSGQPGAAAHVESTVDQAEVIAGDSVQMQVQVQDQAGNTIAGAAVRFVAQSPETTVDPAEASTDNQGIARATVQTSMTPGANQVAVHVADLPPQVVPVQGKIGPPARLTVQAQPMATIAGSTVTVSLQVHDRRGHAVADVPIELALGEAPLTTVASDAAGAAQAAVRLPTEPGEQTLVATVAGLEPERLKVLGHPPTALHIQPAEATVAIQGTQAFRALVTDDFGHTLEITPEWRVTGRNGTMTPQGMFAATALGPETLVARHGTLTAEARVTVVPGAVAKLAITPAEATVMSGMTQSFQATAFNAHGYRLDVAPQWEVTNDVGRVDTPGVFTATQAGKGDVIISLEEHKAMAHVTVVPGPLAALTLRPQEVQLRAGEEQQFEFKGYDAAGNEVEVAPSWKQEPQIGRVSAAGHFHAEQVGNTTLMAQSGDLQATAQVTVTPGALTDLAIEPAEVVVQAGTPQLFQVRGVDAYGNAVPVEPTWEVKPELGDITEDGQFTPTLAQPGTVTASAAGISASARVTIEPGALKRLELTPAELTLQAGEQVEMTVTGYDAYGNTVAVEPVWKVAEATGTITSEGVVTAQRASTGTVVVTSGAVSAEARITVHPGPLVTIAVTPETAKMRSGEQQTFSATGHDMYGNTVAIEPAWSVAGGVGRFDAPGLFSATTTGLGAVVAVVGGIAGQAMVRVEAAQ